jgi:hypothetical protein
MSKPSYDRASGILVAANGFCLSRVQNLDVSVDLGEEEAKELTNDQTVEYTSTNPNVTCSIETNEYGSCRNLRAIAEVTGGSAADKLTINNFDGTSADLCVKVEENGVLARSLVMNDAFLTSISWNWDQGGVATEAFNFETDNHEWLKGAKCDAFTLMGYYPTGTSGVWTCAVPLPSSDYANYTAYRLYIDGVLCSGTPVMGAGQKLNGVEVCMVTGVDTAITATGTRFRAILYKTSAGTTITQATSTSSIGSIPRGKLNLYLVSGAGDAFPTATNTLRVQTLSADVDLAREQLNEIGHFRSYSRALTLPVNVNLSMSTIASDLEEYAKFTGQDYSSATALNITSFLKTAKMKVEIYDANDTATTRNLLKSLTFSGIQVVGESFGVDAGGNATQDYTLKCSNFLVSGAGTPGFYPITAAPTD